MGGLAAASSFINLLRLQRLYVDSPKTGVVMISCPGQPPISQLKVRYQVSDPSGNAAREDERQGCRAAMSQEGSFY